MASTNKRITGDYNIYADNTTIYGNVKIVGTSANVYVANSTIEDNTLIVNNGETGAGVTAGTSGLEIARGSLLNAKWLFTENTTPYFSATINSTLINLRSADPIANSDVVTKSYLSTNAVAVGAYRAIEYNNSGILGGDAQFSYYSNGNVVLGTTLISNTNIYSSTGNNDIKLNAGGTGVVYVQDVLKLDFQSGSTPTNVASTVQILANTPGAGGTGLYIVNNNYSDELVSKRKATWLGIAFS